MKKKLIFCFTSAFFLISITTLYAQSDDAEGSFSKKQKKIIYFNPEVFPDIEEIKEPTNTAFFSALSDKLRTFKNNKLLRVNTQTSFDHTLKASIEEFCTNNNADFAVIPKVKYFKIGIGKYVFSNQVVVSMKLYDSQGNFVTESNYDTYKKNARIIGSAENSIKIGTNGALRKIIKDLKKKKLAYLDGV